MHTFFPCKQDGAWNRQTVFLGKAGSTAYGTATPESDIDLRGVFMADVNQIIGMQNVECYTEEQPIDLQCYEFRHFVKLCLRGSPLQIEMLFYPSDAIGHQSEIWFKLLEIRKAFLSKELKKTLGGFTQGDIKRIEGNLTQKCGAKGKALIEKYGYNTKHASNAYRLLKMSERLWLTGELEPRLPEDIRNEIVAIKRGKYTREEFLNYIKGEDQRVFDLADKSSLPAHPDRELIENIVVQIMFHYLQGNYTFEGRVPLKDLKVTCRLCKEDKPVLQSCFTSATGWTCASCAHEVSCSRQPF